MSKYFVFQVPYHPEESQFLLQVLQTAAKAHGGFHERASVVTDGQTDSTGEGSPYMLIKKEAKDPQATPDSVLASIF